jgi:hypothetical protein
MEPARMLVVLALCWSAQLALAQAATTMDPPVLARAIVRDLAAGRYSQVEARYSDHGAYVMPRDGPKDMWQLLRGQFGPLRRIAGVRQEDSGEAHAQIVTCDFARGSVGLRIELDEFGRIDRLAVTEPTVASLPTTAAVEKDAPRIVEEDIVACMDAENVSFTIENPGETPLLIALSVERWSADQGLRARWTRVQSKFAGVRRVRLEPQSKREIVWVANQPSRPPRLVAGRYRLLAQFTRSGGHVITRAVLRELDIGGCIEVLE